jgi:acyl carrier protein
MNIALSAEQMEIVRGIVAEEVHLPPEQITPEARFEEDLNTDSLTIVEIGLKLEERLSLVLNDEEYVQVKTVAELYDLISRVLPR